jgi:cobalt-precorrin 5A hydrolase
MAGGETVIAVGIGCRAGAPADRIAALVERALSLISAERQTVILVSHERKAAEAGLAAAAEQLGLPLRFLPHDAVKAADGGTVTRSSHSLEATGIASFSEAAALAGAGPGARLVLERIVGDGVTCAIAQGETP